MTGLLVKTFIKDSGNTKDPQVRQRYGTLSGCVGIGLNLLLCAGKLLAGALTGSIAITADAFNNLSDAGASVVTLVGFRLAGARADDDHPYGHGRIEYLSGLAVAVAILLVGVELLRGAVEKILHPEAVEFSVASMLILGAAVLVKLWMYRFNRGLSKRIGSSAMAATATDSLTDAAATAAVLLGALVGRFFDLQVDGWVGILVAAFILRSGWCAAKDTIDPLLGQSPDGELVREIQATVLAHPQVVGMHDLAIHDYGPGRRMMSFHAEIPMEEDILEAHDQIDAIERELKRKFGIETTIHMDPIATRDERTNELRRRVTQLVQEIDPEITVHDFRITPGPLHTNLIFDIAAPHSCRLSDEELRSAVAEKVAGLEGSYFLVLQVDRTYAAPVK